MSGVPIVIVGTISDSDGTKQVTITGIAGISGLHVGHPLPQPPLGIWGGGGVGNYPDAGFPGPQPGGPVRPWGPINYPDNALPPIPTQPPANPADVKPPPPDGGWGWHPDYGWGYFPGEGGKPHPGK